MKQLLIAAALMAILTGCTTKPDPWQAAMATEKENRAAIELETNRARIDQAAYARMDQTNLQALQAHQAAVQAAGQIAQAQAISAVVASNNQTVLAVAQVVSQASKTDYTPVYVGMTLATVIIIAYMLIAARRPAQAAQAPKLIAPLPKLLPSPPGTELWLYPNGELQQIWIEPFDSRILAPGDPMYRKLLTDMGGKR